MKNISQTPITTESSWKERALKAEAQVEILSREMEYLKAQLRLLIAKRFSPSSEKTNKNQLTLFDSVFNEAEATADPSASEPELITIKEHKRVKSKGKKGIDLESLPENIIEYHLPEEEMACWYLGTEKSS
jgi:transposase